ncbi:hypothetical protein Lalb_Chr23g0267221 [Lupinus albus]|uniref:Uncharacterized protein n=1 Tax=Lupinus albus TaxID=3870 RepID=A0A6A4NBA5_LUPAL|nr:hypothetical protein Lalb_Chr23g0267221 [Lupinus albus]
MINPTEQISSSTANHIIIISLVGALAPLMMIQLSRETRLVLKYRNLSLDTIYSG